MTSHQLKMSLLPLIQYLFQESMAEVAIDRVVEEVLVVKEEVGYPTTIKA